MNFYKIRYKFRLSLTYDLCDVLLSLSLSRQNVIAKMFRRKMTVQASFAEGLGALSIKNKSFK